MRISTKIAIALGIALLLFALFLSLSRVTMLQIQKQGRYVMQINELSRDMSNIVIGSRVFQDRMTGANYVEESLATSRSTMVGLTDGADQLEVIFIRGMMERLDEFSDVFQQLVKSTGFLAQLDIDVREKVLRFSVMHQQMQGELEALHEEMHHSDYAEIEPMEATEMFLLEHAKLWGWMNRAVSSIDRDLILNDDLTRFNQNFNIAREAYEESLAELKLWGPLVAVEGMDGYLQTLEDVLVGLRSVAIEFTVSGRAEGEAAQLLESHGERLREMVDRLMARATVKGERLGANLSLIYWLSALIILIGSIFLTVWFSLSISRPLTQLANNFKEVAGGNFNLRIPAEGRSELDDLARAFNDMTEKLRVSYSEVEEKVRQRTKELQLATVRSKQLADAAQEANLAKSAFLATMSHEIRTPLNSILGFSEMLEETPLDDEQRTDLQTIRTSGAILLDLINEILDLSKIEAGKVFMDVSVVRLDEAIHEVSSLFRLNAERSGIQLDVDIDEKALGSVMTDRTRLQQVLNNLVSNAVKFTSHGEIIIKVWVEDHSERAGMRYYISISDTGIGIPEDKLSDVFLAFTQADSSTTRKYGGTGLGLAISSRLVELLGGEISVESTEGLGSNFTFYIRNLEGGANKSDDNSSYAKRELKFETLPRVLLVEDDVANYTLASKILGRFGLSVDWAKNGLEAVEAFKKKQYDLVFMDLQMPVMDGVEATTQIRQLRLEKEPYIAALTANALSESRNACAQAGMQDFITKPVSSEALKAALLRFQERTYNQG